MFAINDGWECSKKQDTLLSRLFDSKTQNEITINKDGDNKKKRKKKKQNNNIEGYDDTGEPCFIEKTIELINDTKSSEAKEKHSDVSKTMKRKKWKVKKENDVEEAPSENTNTSKLKQGNENEDEDETYNKSTKRKKGGNELPVNTQENEEAKEKKKKRRKKRKEKQIIDNESTTDVDIKVSELTNSDKQTPNELSDNSIVSNAQNDTISKKVTKFQQKMSRKLEGGHFRYINEKLYTTDSHFAVGMFKRQPSLFDVYHKGFESQVEHWPENPVNLIIDYIKEQYDFFINFYYIG